MHQAGGRQHLLALDAVGFPLAVPALEGLGDAVPDRVGEPEVLAESRGGAPVIHIHLLQVMPPVGEEPDSGFDALSERPAVADVSQQERDAAEGVGVVDVRGVVLERLVVPKPLRLFIGVDVASQPGQHGGVIHDLAFLLVHREAFSEVQGDVGLPQHVLGGVAQPKIGTKGERGEEFCHSYARSFHAPIVMPRRRFVRRRNGMDHDAAGTALA